MKKKKDKKKIIKENPAVDKELFEKSRKEIEELRRIGIKDCQYNLIPPFGYIRP